MPRKYTQEEFLKLANEKHQGKIDFSNFVYINSLTEGECKCNICGKVWQTRADVILRGCGCSSCSKGKHQLQPFEKIQERVSKLFPNIILDKDEYIDTKHKCKTYCKDCGNIWHPKPNDLLNGHGCKICAIQKSIHTKEEVNELLKHYQNDFDLRQIEYKGCHNKVSLICKKCGEIITHSFNYWISNIVKCPCNDDYKHSRKEVMVKNSLLESNTSFIRNNRRILNGLELDFFIPSKNIAIECQGDQHFKPIFFGGMTQDDANKKYIKQVERDKYKKQLCQEKGITLLYLLDREYNSHMESDDVYFNDVETLMNYLKNYGTR